MKSFLDLIKEDKQVGTLYHWTSYVNLYKIIENDYLKSSERTTDRGAKTIPVSYGVSFTRNKKVPVYEYYPSEVGIIVNGDKLSNNYKLFPYNDFFMNKSGIDEMETRTDKSIEPVLPYIEKILINKTKKNSEKEFIDFMKYQQEKKNLFLGFKFETSEEFFNQLFSYVKSHNINCEFIS